MSTYVIGDIHGCGTEFRNLLASVNFDRTKDTCILVGDLFDRGLFPAVVWDTIKEIGAISLLGNHERKLARLARGESAEFPPHYHWCLARLNEHGVSNEEIADYIAELPKLLILEDYKTIIAHGGVVIGDPRKENISANVYGTFDPNKPAPGADGKPVEGWWDQYEGDFQIVYGHIFSEQPRIRHNSVGIDQGCCHGYKLTAYCLETKQFTFYPAVLDWFSKLRQDLKYEKVQTAKTS